MTDISDDYDPFWDDDREPDYDYDLRDPMEGYEPEPDYEAISRYEHARTMRSLSPPGRVVYWVRGLVRRYTWRWRMKIRARWPLLTGRATTESDEPPF